jgi:hypothetical protein
MPDLSREYGHARHAWQFATIVAARSWSARYSAAALAGLACAEIR